jgi:hypothetical protein
LLSLQVKRLYDPSAMTARNPARYLAPLALIAALAGTYEVVHSALNTKQTVAHAVSATVRASPRGRFGAARFYAVRAGDSLSSIAAQAGVSLSALESLNPRVDPNALQAGQRLRLRR